MYFLTPSLLQHAIQVFRDLDLKGPADGDRFFETFGPGNLVLFADRPFERFHDYEALLAALQAEDPAKYEVIHKGTPYYFLAWTAFELRNHEKALFYMDAAVAEDIRKDPARWLEQPAAAFLTLQAPRAQVAARVAAEIQNSLDAQLDRFNAISGLAPLDRDAFVEEFVKPLLNDLSTRTIVSAFYTFMLEFWDRYRELCLRSAEGGSVEPFVTHLFKGGLIFESLLKQLYPNKDDGDPAKTLGQIFRTTAFQADFLASVSPSADSLRQAFNGITGNDIQSAFDTTSRLRNTTGHNLVWADVEYVLGDPENYRMMFEQEVNALLYVVATKFR